MSDFIVDASVVAKWFLPEADSIRARSLIDRNHYLRAPDLLLPELANVLWKRSQRKEMTGDEVHSALDIFLRHHIDITVRLLPSRLGVKQALRIAVAENRSVYDSLYLAFAVQSGCKLVTADDRLMRAIRSPIIQRHVVCLRNVDLA